MTHRIGIYPGSFDPITMGHANIVERSLGIFDEVVVAVLNHPDKRSMFTPAERVGLIADSFVDEPRVTSESFEGLLVDYVHRRGSGSVIRGLRAVQDFEYEFQMTTMNRRLAPDIDTVFMMTDQEYFYIASRTVKEIASLGGDIDGLVPPGVKRAILEKVGRAGRAFVIRLSDRVRSIEPSATFAIKAKAASLRSRGIAVVDLSVGEPDGTPPDEALAGAEAAIAAGEHGYAPLAGLRELRTAIAHRYRDLHGLTYSASNVLVTMGGKQALYHCAQALLDEGDEVIVFAPYWVSYLPQIELAGARAIVVRTRSEDGFQPDIDEVRAAIGPRTRAILVNSPSNPTGTVIERHRLVGLAELAEEHGLTVISDEIYDAMVFESTGSSCLAGLTQGAPARTIIVNAVSKTWAMTGWRVGWLVGPEEFIKACSKLQGHSTSGVCAVNQRAALGALSSPASNLAPIVQSLRHRRDLMATGLSNIEGLMLDSLPGGAFYLFPRVDGLFGTTRPDGSKIVSSLDVADHLLTDGGVAVVPGEAFGEPRCIRLSYAVSAETIDAALARIRSAVSRLSV